MSELALKLIAENKKNKAKTLDLGNCGLTELPDELFELTWLEELVLSNYYWVYDLEKKKINWVDSNNESEYNQLKKLSPKLSGLNALKKLYLNEQQELSDLSPLSGLSNLQIFSCESTQVNDLSPLSGLSNLQVLGCGRTQVSDLGPLSGLRNLQLLRCFATQVSDLGPLSGLTNLQGLWCSSTQVSDLSPLSGLRNLQGLWCSATQVSDLSPLSGLTNLQELVCFSTQVSDLSPLSGLSNLHKFNCFATQVSDLSPLSGLSNLQEFNCFATQVSDLSPLTGLTKLQNLSCSKTQVNDLSPLSELGNLHVLDCFSTQVSDLSPLTGLSNLQVLECSSTQVSDLSPLTGLSNLQVLECSSTQVSDLSPLSGLRNLQELRCSSTQVSDLSPLTGLSNLQVLDCSSTQVSVLSPLSGLTNLQVLRCEFTQIKKILPLTKITALSSFNVDNCPIEDCPADIYQQKNIELLRQYFEQNPSTAPEVARMVDTRRDVKLILLGNSAAGKTHLLHYLKTGEYLGKRDSTHGLEVHRWLPDADRFRTLADVAVSVWDFGGQEYYHEAYRLFMSDNAVYLLLWDTDTDLNGRRPTCLRSGEPDMDLEHFEIKYWLDTVRHYGGKSHDTPLLVVQNKTDLPAGKKRLDQQLHEAFDIRESLHISLMQGCLPGQSRERVLLQHFDIELEQALALTADKVALPADWLDIRQRILDLQEGKAGSPFEKYLAADGSVSLDEFEKAAAEVIGKPTQTSPEALPNTFQRGGVVAFFPESKKIGTRVFLKPAQLAARIYDILQKEVLALGGEFNPNKIFKKEDNFKTVFLEVAQNLDLIFTHPQREGYFIAPQYLPATHPIEDLFKIAAHNAFQSAFWLRVPLFYYKKLLHNLVLHYAADASTESRYFWKHGIVFLKNGLRVLIKGLYPAENERDGILLVGVEPAGDGSHRALQKGIFEQCLDFLGFRGGVEEKGQSTPEHESNKGMEMSIGARVMLNVIKHFIETERKRMSILEVSKDNEFFIKYTDLIAAAERNDIKIEARNKAGESDILLLRDFEALLPRVPRRGKKVFVSYSHSNTQWLSRLRAHLSGLRRSNVIEDWTDQEILPGEQWDKAIREKVKEADVFILMLSADFVASEYIWEKELKPAFERFKQDKKTLIPIYVEPFDIGSLPNIIEEFDEKGLAMGIKIQDIEIIPKDENGRLKAVSLWHNHEEALATVAARIRAAVKA
jgi:Leucine-rich repeat (LRR) protein/GTPase SAR1 family protein